MKPYRIINHQRIEKTKKARAMELRREMTEAERMLWQRIRGNRLQGLHFRRQQVIDGFIADFYCHTVALVLELDGSVHDRQVDYDEARDRVIAKRGIRIIRIKNGEIEHNMDDVLRRIAEACQCARGNDGD